MKKYRRISIRLTDGNANTIASMLGWELQTRNAEFEETPEGKAARSFLVALKRAYRKREKRFGRRA